MACLSPPEYHMFLEDREYQMTAFLFLAPRQIAGIDYISHYQKKKVNCLFSIIFQKKKGFHIMRHIPYLFGIAKYYLAKMY